MNHEAILGFGALALGTWSFLWLCWKLHLACQRDTSEGRRERDSMAKGQWEGRVGDLLKVPEFVWHFKPPDGSLYGGSPRIDYIACDVLGRCILIEVKQLPPKRQSFTVDREVSPGQRMALDAIAQGSANGIAILAVGCGDDLYLYNWGKICRQKTAHFVLEDDLYFAKLHWNGPQKWKGENLYTILMKKFRYEPHRPMSGLPTLVGAPPSYVSMASYPTPTMSPPDRRLEEIRLELEKEQEKRNKLQWEKDQEVRTRAQEWYQAHREIFDKLGLPPPTPPTSIEPVDPTPQSPLPAQSYLGHFSQPGSSSTTAPTTSAKPSPSTEKSPSISKPKDSIRTKRKKLLSALQSSRSKGDRSS